ncbi:MULTISPECIES: hypothetical protein [unclassified Pseudonocardia]|uniref:hypothetical protein n=1 Tax=unclassified Pseudonocardia TaxID=2619320 RepID=UPI0007616D4B|nr:MULTISPECIES: hypothetical protein [unclassified Pseudonocardia]
MPDRIDQQQLAQQFIDTARQQGVELVGPGGMLAEVTKTMLETRWKRRLASTWDATHTTPLRGTRRTLSVFEKIKLWE